MHHPTDRIIHTTAFVTPVVEHWLEREIAQWVHPMKDRSDDPSHHERTLLPQSYISLPWFRTFGSPFASTSSSVMFSNLWAAGPNIIPVRLRLPPSLCMLIQICRKPSSVVVDGARKNTPTSSGQNTSSNSRISLFPLLIPEKRESITLKK